MRVFLLQVARTRDSGPFGPPRDLALIAQALEKAGRDLRLLDGRVKSGRPREIAGAVNRFRPDLLLAVTDDPVDRVEPGLLKRLFIDLNGRLPFDTEIALIGPHGIAFPESVLSALPGVRFVACDPRPGTILALARAVEGGDPFAASSSVFSPRPGTILPIPGTPPPVEELDLLPAYHLLPMARYAPPFPIPFREHALLQEFDLLVRRYAVRRFHFLDPCPRSERSSWERFLKEMENQRPSLTWSVRATLEEVRESSLETWSRTGCREIDLVLDPETLALEETERVLKKGRAVGLLVRPTVLFEGPSHDLEQVNRTLTLFHGRGIGLSARLALPPRERLNLEIVGRTQDSRQRLK